MAGPSSLLVDPTSQSEITNAVERVWKSEDLRKQMIESGYSFAQHFRDKNIAETWNKTYLSLL